MSWDVEMAKLLKERSKKRVPTVDVIFGDVKQINPLKVMLLDGAATIYDEDIVYTRASRNIEIKSGDTMILLPINDMSNFVFLDLKG